MLEQPMIIFKNINPIEVSEGEGRVIIEIDPIASEITAPTEFEIFTTNGSAISTVFDSNGVGVDFNPIASSIVTVDPQNSDTLTFAIDITDDEIIEPDENFQFQIASLTDETLNGTANVNIVDNDSDNVVDEIDNLVGDRPLPQITIDSVEQLEGDGDSNEFEFTVSLSEASTEAIAVDYTTVDGTGESADRLENNIAIDLADYIPLNGTLEFEPGETTQTLAVTVLADDLALVDEARETVSVSLSNAVNAEIETIFGTGTILDDDLNDEPEEIEDSQPTFLQLDEERIIEGDNGEITTEELMVRLVNADGEPVVAEEDVTFEYSTVDVTAAADVDYEFISSQTGTITTGRSSVNIPINIIGDPAIEPDETFLLTLAERETEITIIDNDSLEALEIEDFRENDVFRFFNSDTGGYLYTASDTERNFVQQNLENYILERSSYASIDPNAENAEEIYRFYNSNTGGYFYTASEIERDAIIDNLDKFVFENIAFYAFDSEIENTIPVYRFFETNNGVHFYTANETERAFVEDNLSNYNFEGIAFYALPPAADLI